MKITTAKETATLVDSMLVEMKGFIRAKMVKYMPTRILLGVP